MLVRLRSALSWILARHISEPLPERERRSFRLTIQLQAIAILITAGMWFVPVAPGEDIVLHAASALFLVEMLAAWLLLRNGFLLLAQTVTLLALSIHVSAMSFGLTPQHAHFFYPIAALLPLLIFRNRAHILRMILTLIPVTLFVFHQYYFKVLGGEALFGPRPTRFTFEEVVLDAIISQMMLLLLVYQFVRGRDVAEEKLEQEYAKSEELLQNILPREIVEELKEKGVTEPRLHRSTSICFTDFEGFTRIAESFTPTELVGELDRCFSYFDSLMGRHNLEKLKTIGDSYMFAGGIPVANSTHAVDCVLAALEIQAFMNQMKEVKSQQGLPCWELRLGIHSGDVVAGVIGEKKFAYDVWSDTVNTASRCESSGAPGRINISGATYELVKDFFECEYRGAIPAKNKGEIDMYFVSGIRKELRREGEAQVPNAEFQSRYQALVDAAALR